MFCLVLLGASLAAAGEEAPKGHWAFQPPAQPNVPAVRQAERALTDVDRFLLAALEKHGLSFAPEAERATLLRRLSFDLTGLPPSPAEVAAFLADPAPGAYDRMVEHYLASPHYGERWGGHWLDAAGYADSNGYFHADSDRPLAHRYRDYVIRCFNEDKPFDRFVEEQLAGDELAGYEPGGDVTGAMADLLTATHFLRNAQDGTGESDGNPDEVRTDRLRVLEDTLEIVMSSLQGITIQCARCHDHKFEPISQMEYYQLQALFAPAYHPERWLKPGERVVTVGTRAEREEHEKRVEALNREIKALRESLESSAAPLSEALIAEKLEAASEPLRSELGKARGTPEKERSDAQKKLLKEHEAIVTAGEEEIAKRFPQFAQLRESIRSAVAAKEKERPPPLPAIAGLFDVRGEPLPFHLKIRGLHDRPGEAVEPAVPAILCGVQNPFKIEKPAAGASSGRRLSFARWVTSLRNPLFARVTANRIWQHHFGIGLVSTPANLGRSGAPPSHPELLDYLATKLVESGFSVKAMHRLILASAAYRQSSALPEAARPADPENRLLWRFPILRLDAESLRDAMLCATGELDRRQCGPYVPTQNAPDGQVFAGEKVDGAMRRSIYLKHRRTEMPTLLGLFDTPVMVTNCTRRSASTVPLQSLALLNSEFVRARSRAFAARLEREAGPLGEKKLDDERIGMAFLLALGRGPSSAEREASWKFLKAQRELFAADPSAASSEWTDFCQMVLASNTFLYVD